MANRLSARQTTLNQVPGKAWGKLNHHRLGLLSKENTTSPSLGHAKDIYEAMKYFKWFNFNRNMTAMTVPATTDDGREFILFDALGLFGFGASLINWRWVPVRVWFHKSKQLITADTTGSHMLVGQRRWSVTASSNGSKLLVTTESYDQPRGFLNWMAFKLLGQRRQTEVWVQYFENVEMHMKRKGFQGFKAMQDVEDLREKNPWQPISPYPPDGEMV